MESSKLRQQIIVGLISSAVLSALLAVAAVAQDRSEDAQIGPMKKVMCTLSPRATVTVDEDTIEVNPPDVVIPC